MADTAIFLGAGASTAEGAPLQTELFQQYFSSQHFKDSHELMDRDLAAFFKQMFQIDVERPDISQVSFPTFEEVLGLTDLAIMRKEAFRHFDIEGRAATSGRLRLVAQYLVFLVARVLAFKLQGRTAYHRQLVSALREAGQLRNIVFISTNYDILIDNALVDEYRHEIDVDYGVDFRNFDKPGDWQRPHRDRSVFLFKPHGSLNWLFCPTCNELEITPKEKGVVTHLISEYADRRCSVCRSIFSPLIVPPTFYKDLNNVFLSEIWNRTDITLRKVNHIVFCGYSFPDADIHVKYLLKRAQTNRDGNTPLKVTVINHHTDKMPDDSQKEERRFKRFLGNCVEYTTKTFQEFATDPIAHLRLVV